MGKLQELLKEFLETEDKAIRMYGPKARVSEIRIDIPTYYEVKADEDAPQYFDFTGDTFCGSPIIPARDVDQWRIVVDTGQAKENHDDKAMRELHELALQDPIVHRAMQFAHHNKLSNTVAMVDAIKALVIEKNFRTAQVKTLIESRPPNQ